MDVWASSTRVDLQILAPKPALAGWEFLAVVEPLDGGNLIRQVPGSVVSEGELAAWRGVSISCDHCRADRRRAETFLLRADGSDPAVESGTHRQVGRSCLRSFLGGKSAAAIVEQLAWPDLVRGVADDGDGGWGGGGGRAVRELNPVRFLAQVAACVRIDGWCSRSAARADNKQSTSDVAIYLMTPPLGDGRAEAAWKMERDRLAPDQADQDLAVSALAWARDLSGSSDYEQNLRLVAGQGALQISHAGILASAIHAYGRHRSEIAARSAARLGSSTHVGTEGAKDHALGSVTCERVSSYDTSFGTTHVHTFRDDCGNAIVWKTDRRRAQPGDRIALLVATIKRHSEYRGEAQTEIQRASLLDDAGIARRDAEAVAKASRAAKAAARSTARAARSSGAAVRAGAISASAGQD